MAKKEKVETPAKNEEQLTEAVETKALTVTDRLLAIYVLLLTTDVMNAWKELVRCDITTLELKPETFKVNGGLEAHNKKGIKPKAEWPAGKEERERIQGFLNTYRAKVKALEGGHHAIPVMVEKLDTLNSEQAK